MSSDYICERDPLPDEYKGDAALTSLFECQQALKCYQETAQENDRINKRNDEKKVEHKKLRESWKGWNDEFSEWKNKTGKYSKWGKVEEELQSERKKTRNWACEGSSWAGRSGWCSNDHGGGWVFESHRKDSWQPCSWVHICKRSSDNVKKDLDKAGYKNSMPTKDPETGIYWYGTKEPSEQTPNLDEQHENDAIIQCCGNVINAGDGNDLTDIKQSCSQEVNQKIVKLDQDKDLLKDAYPEDSETDSETEDSETTVDKKKSKKNQGFLGWTTWGIITGVVVMVLLILSISSSLALSVSNSKSIK